MDISELIDKRIAELNDWRGPMLARLRKLVLEAAPGIEEEWKWDTPVWFSNGDVVAVGAFQDHLKMNFFHGALLEDHHLFNAGLDAKNTRAIDIFENDEIDDTAIKSLIQAAVTLNNSRPKKPARSQTRAKTASAKKKTNTARTKRFGKN